MCGIVGVVEFQPGSPDPNALSDMLVRMAGALVHRGPDDRGFHVNVAPGAVAALGVQRLSIVDPAGGRQPMFSEDGRIVAVCNGEIYNHRELRETLAEQGHRFLTGSDAEVIPHLYEQFGLDFPRHLRGMFAVALWDQTTERLVLVRDRLGIKPLYLQGTHGRCVFASEVRALLPALEQPPAVRPDAVLQSLRLQYIPGPASALDRIEKLEPGTIRVMTGQGTESRRYWNPPMMNGHNETRTDEACMEEIRTRLHEAVNSHLLGDVPIGMFLSGGLDSTSVLSFMVESGPVRSFAVGFEGAAESEDLRYAEVAARAFGARHEAVLLRPADIPDALPQIVRHLDEPLTDPATVPTYVLARRAAGSVKVVLTGEGADELFGGYLRYRLEHLRPWWAKLPGPIRRLVARTADPVAGRRGQQAVAALSENTAARRHVAWASTFTAAEWRDLLIDQAQADREDEHLAGLFSSFLAERNGNGHAAAGMLRADLHTWLTDDLLTKVDRMTMAVSLEARVPFLDHPLVELVASLPADRLLGLASGKVLLRRAMRGRVPERILRRRKMGFEWPVDEWIRGPLRSYIADLLALDPAPGLLNARTMSRYWDEHMARRQNRGRQLWALALTKLWWHEWNRSERDVVAA